MNKQLGKLNIVIAIENTSLISEPTANLLRSVMDNQQVGVAEIDDNFSDTNEFCKQYQVSLSQTANCIVVKANRGDKNWYAACVVFGNSKADVNGLVRRHLGARRVSFAPMEEAVSLTKMEYGGITPVGLPADWPILIDKSVANASDVVLGSGIRKSKLIVTGKFLESLPGAVVLEGLGMLIS